MPIIDRLPLTSRRGLEEPVWTHRRARRVRRNHSPAISLLTVTSYQRPPRGVRIPRRSSSRAIPQFDVTPVERIAAMIGKTRARQAAAEAFTAAIAATLPLPAASRARPPSRQPSLTPRALAAASAALV